MAFTPGFSVIPPRCFLQLARPLPSLSARQADGRGRHASLSVVFGSLMWKWAAQSFKLDPSFCGKSGAYWEHTPHCASPACFSCSTVSFAGGGFFSTFLSSSLLTESQPHLLCRGGCRGGGAGHRTVGPAQWLLPSVLSVFVLKGLLNPLLAANLPSQLHSSYHHDTWVNTCSNGTVTTAKQHW